MENKVILLLFVIQAGTVMAYFTPGKCAAPTLFADFNMTRYAGLWYEIGCDFTSLRGKDTTTCTTANYTLRPDGFLDVHNSWTFNNTR
jgi:lipocalin